ANITHPLLDQFKITPKFALNAKIYEPVDGASAVGIFVTVGMRFEIDAAITDLVAAGVDVTGMYVVRREPAPEQRRLAGRIAAIIGGDVALSEASDAETSKHHEIKLEGSKENFSRCLSTLLGARYKTLMNALDDQEASYRLGPGFDETV